MDNTLLTNDTLQLLLQIAAMIATLFMSTQIGERFLGWFVSYKKNRTKVAVRLLEAGVIYAFKYAYRELKEKTGKLSTEDAQKLRDIAVSRAIDVSIKDFGKDKVSAALTPDDMDIELEKIVNNIKARLNQPT